MFRFKFGSIIFSIFFLQVGNSHSLTYFFSVLQNISYFDDILLPTVTPLNMKALTYANALAHDPWVIRIQLSFSFLLLYLPNDIFFCSDGTF